MPAPAPCRCWELSGRYTQRVRGMPFRIPAHLDRCRYKELLRLRVPDKPTGAQLTSDSQHLQHLTPCRLFKIAHPAAFAARWISPQPLISDCGKLRPEND